MNIDYEDCIIQKKISKMVFFFSITFFLVRKKTIIAIYNLEPSFEFNKIYFEKCKLFIFIIFKKKYSSFYKCKIDYYLLFSHNF